MQYILSIVLVLFCSLQPAFLYAADSKFQSVNTVEETLALVRQNKGKVVILALSASYCSACVKEVPELMELQKKNPDVAIYTLLIDDSDTTAQRFVDRSKSTLPTYKTTGDVAYAFNALVIPLLAVYGASGKLYTVAEGLKTTEELQKLYDAAKKH